ncbi:MAG: hypothetical protein QOJ27_2223 [Sphingomonadales bacterium]|nr:hypothetical protein [Sphingomonadales bacterium]
MRLLLALSILWLPAALLSQPPRPIAAGSLFLSPMGEPFRSEDSAAGNIGRWFSGADRDGDGALTPAEMRDDAARFFALLDTDGDGEIEPAEMARYETEVAPEVQLGLQMRGVGVGAWVAPNRRHRRIPVYEPGIEGAGRYSFLNIPQPVIAADLEMNRGVSRNEFASAADRRFALLDSDKDGRLLRTELPPLPQPTLRRPGQGRGKDKEVRAPGGPARQPTELR